MAGIKGSYQIKGTNIPGAMLLVGKFTTAGTSAPSVYTMPGMTIAAPSTGVYTITIDFGTGVAQPLAGAIGLALSIEDSTTNANDTVRWGDVDAVTTAGTFTIITASSAGTDANLTGPVIGFELLVWDTSLSR